MPPTHFNFHARPALPVRATIERFDAVLLKKIVGRHSPRSGETPAQAAGSMAPFNVVILYEHLVYVRRAMATYLHLMRELAGDFEPDFRLWQIDQALEPELTAEAERDIAAAEVIIMAVNGREVCPPPFQRWKDHAGQSGGPPPHAVIALMEGSDEPDPPPESWSGVLRSTATQIHPEVFVCDPVEAPLPVREMVTSG